ncbi:hypothetical protein RZZ46_10655 [Citrobacter amalonaticus]|nr:hypothetical protein [Citrobacter amalonaticus]
MLLPVFICDGENLYSASTRAAYTRFAPHVCGTLHDVWREHSCSAKNTWTPRHKNDNALCSPSPGSS